MTPYARFGKRLFDVAASTAALVVLSPVLAVTAVAVRVEDRGPALFVSERVGRDGKLFKFLKFRSMPVNTAHVPSNSAGALQITRTGRVIRRTSIDELPQLFSILRGDMSVVGPRPAIPAQETLRQLREENGALACRPGLTGLAQINSYDAMPEDVKAAYDGKYAQHISLLGDLKIILGTFRYLLSPPPAY
ncbi:MAG: sugar transferase [Rubricoccaceae bacterium]